MKKKVGLFDVLIFFMIAIALFFILHFGGVIFLRLNIGKKYAKDGEITELRARAILESRFTGYFWQIRID